MVRNFLLAVLCTIGCSGGGGGSPGDGGGGDLGAGDAGARRDLGGGATDGASDPCAMVTCGANAACDPTAGACRCNAGFDGDPKLGCSKQTLCGSCPQFAHCDATSNLCACDPGYLLMGNACAVATPSDPATRAPADVCNQWKQGHVLVDPKPYTAGAMMCDPGTLSPAGITDTLRRADLFRWLGGLYPITDDATWDMKDQLAAVMEAANGTLNHTPPMNWKCWSQAAYDASSSSNLAEGVANAADSIDLYMDDSGTPSLGHRRWVMNPPLDGVGVGYANSFSALHVFGGGNQAPPSKWQAVPNPGAVPTAVAGFTVWSFHADGVALGGATVTVLRVDDMANLPVTVVQLPDGYGVNAVGWTHGGWAAQAGKTYRVTVSGSALGDVTYDVKPVVCN